MKPNTCRRCLTILMATLMFSFLLPTNAKRLKVGVVFGGGGAKGAAEVGVLKYIEKAGIPVDYIVGTSIGSIVGGMYASGVRPERMEEFFLGQDWISLFTDRDTKHKTDLFAEHNGVYYVFGFPVYNENRSMMRNGLLRGDSITSLLGQLSGYTQYTLFDSLKIPFRCVTVDLETMKEVVLDRGVLPECMRASMSIPLAFTTANNRGRNMIDGGAINNLPVDVAKKMGADIVIAIDLSTDDVDESRTGNQVGDLILDIAGQFDLGPVANWVIRRPDNKRYKENLKMADLVIQPKLKGYNVASFTPEKVKQMIKIGEKAGEDAMPELLELWKRITLSRFGVEKQD